MHMRIWICGCMHMRMWICGCMHMCVSVLHPACPPLSLPTVHEGSQKAQLSVRVLLGPHFRCCTHVL